METKKVVVGVVVLALVFGGMFLFSNRPINITVPPSSVVVNPVSDGTGDGTLGATPVLTSPQDWNGVTRIHERLSFKTGTSTVASYKVTATSTLSVNCFAEGGLTFAQEYNIAVGTDPTGTTTASLGKWYVGASGKGEIIASTTSTVFPAGSFVNVKMATTSGTTVATNLAPKGRCMVVGWQF